MLYTQSLCPEEQQRCGFLSLQYLQIYIQTHVRVQQLWGEWAAISCIACTGEGHPVTQPRASLSAFFFLTFVLSLHLLLILGGTARDLCTSLRCFGRSL